MKNVIGFVIPFLCAVISATFILWVCSLLAEAFEPVPHYEVSQYSIGIFATVGAGIMLVSILPAIISTLLIEANGRPPRSIRYAIVGMIVGAVATFVLLFLSTNMDVTDPWVWNSVWKRAYLIPFFAFAGLVGGAVFGITRKQTKRLWS